MKDLTTEIARVIYTADPRDRKNKFDKAFEAATDLLEKFDITERKEEKCPHPEWRTSMNEGGGISGWCLSCGELFSRETAESPF